MTQQSLLSSLTPFVPLTQLVTGIDPGKDMLHCATLRGDGGGSLHDMLKAVEFDAIPWCTGNGWLRACALFVGTPFTPRLGFVLAEAQWADADAQQKWSGLSAICQTSGALRAAAAASGLSLLQVRDWTRQETGQHRVGRQVMNVHAVGLGLAFIEPMTPRNVVRAVE
jgi:hypothetical protein